MKKLLIGAAAGALMAPVAARAETTAFIETTYEHAEASNSNTAVESWKLGGAIQHDFSSSWGIQGDFRSTNFDFGGSTLGANYAAVHVYGSVSQNVDVAAFAGILGLPIGDDGVDVGVEARMHDGPWSLQGSLGYLTFPTRAVNSEAWDGRVSAAWFINQDTSLGPSISYYEWNDGGDILKHLELGASAAHRFGNGLEVQAAYVHIENDSTVIGQYQADAFRVALRLHLNAGDLQTITNQGPSWTGALGIYENTGRF